jgi:homogentisate 1,2-dioxygenase
VGWQGNVAPFRLNINDIRSTSAERLNIPPSGYATFQAPGVLICTFTPHPMQSDPDSKHFPPFHRNVDNDEILLFLEAEGPDGHGLPPGMLLVNPQGCHHGTKQPPQRPSVSRNTS